MKKVGILLIGLSLAGCEVGDRDNKRALLTLLGMGAGGTLGWFTGGDGFTNKFLWSAMLASGGAAGGYYLAERLLPPDREKLDSTAFRALNDAETGQELTWGEEGKGAWGTFKPVRDFIGKDGRSCRAYIATINVDGESGTIKEAACQLQDGGWRTIST